MLSQTQKLMAIGHFRRESVNDADVHERIHDVGIHCELLEDLNGKENITHFSKGLEKNMNYVFGTDGE